MELIIIIFYFILLLFSYFIVLIEASFDVVTKIQTQKLFKELNTNKDANVEKLRKILLQPQKYIITLLLINNFLKFLTPIIPVAAIIYIKNKYILFSEQKYILYLLFALSVIVSEALLIILDIIARYKAKPRAKQTLLKHIFFIHLLFKILNPTVSFFFNLTKKIAHIFRVSLFEKSILVTEDDIKALFEVGKDEGILKEHEIQIFNRLFKFDDLKIKEIMVPAIDMNCIEASLSKPEILKFIVETKHSRIPVFRENLDNIIGILYIKDLLDYMLNNENWELEKILRPAVFTPEIKWAHQLLKQFQKEKIHMSIVVDEYGNVSGLVTIEDILEKLVGDIEDEYDTEDSMIKKLNDNSYLIDAKINLNDLNEELKLNLSGERFESLAGYIISIYGDIPPVGEKIITGNYTFEIVNADERKISKIKLKV